jgi:pimeloyl-ACP methyl ester carboxylesterase
MPPKTKKDKTVLPTPVIVIHGGPASNLLDLYSTTPEEIFTLGRGFLSIPKQHKQWDRVPFHPDDESITLNTSSRPITPARITAINAFFLPYEDLVEALKTNIGYPDDPAPVFPIAYDWRQDSRLIVPVLAAFIDEVLRIVARLPQYKKTPPTKVDIVAHSYGGLVTSRYLYSCQKQSVPTNVRKVVTIATPYRGAAEAVRTMILDNEQREAVRNVPAAWNLFPYYPGACIDISQQQQPPFEVDLLADKNLWNGSSVVQSIENYCTKIGADINGTDRFENLRAGAMAQKADLSSLDVRKALGSEDNWLPIVAFGQETQVRVDIVGRNPVEFDFKKGDKDDATGDNTVPFLGAIPPFDLSGNGGQETPRERLVGIVKGDAGIGEYTDLFGAAVGLGFGSLHSFLPRMDAVQAIVFGFLRDVPPKYKAKAHPVPGVRGQQVNWPASWNLIPVDL